MRPFRMDQVDHPVRGAVLRVEIGIGAIVDQIGDAGIGPAQPIRARRADGDTRKVPVGRAVE
jgi:hypothetical protein